MLKPAMALAVVLAQYIMSMISNSQSSVYIVYMWSLVNMMFNYC